ncbi:MAG TPA: acylphosphatase [Chitinophagaceae bacterium]|nr:acylphosphatase [Chitinophagaceae bacterium]
MLQTISIIVSGNVQGVFYRQSAREKALAIGVKGKVMNLSNGDVQIIATGTKEQLDKLLEWCRQGPPKAKVSNVTSHELPLQQFDSFYIERV